MFKKIFIPTKQKRFNKKIYGFDIETYDNNKKFYCASIFESKQKNWTFYEKQDLIDFFKKERFKNSIIGATNLSFDFFGTFHNNEAIKNFTTLFRGSDLITAKTYLKNKQFNRYYINGAKSLQFIDTLNYSKHSVESLGKILNIPKLEKPTFLGQKPKNNIEQEILKIYNLRDSEISKEYLTFLYNSFYKLGANINSTIAKTSMSLFRNKFLKNRLYQPETNIILEQFKPYYGGRTEAFNRGYIKNFRVYDVNSLYPYVMTFKYPQPNSLRITKSGDSNFINDYEGFSDVLVECPNIDKPILPYVYKSVYETKLLFPTGIFRGTYTHIELRQAIKQGYDIKKVYKTYYYKETFMPFKEFVNELYTLRLEYQKQNSPMEHTIKILLNSLYGKFAQKFLDRDNWIPIPKTFKELDRIKNICERSGNYIRIKEDRQPPIYSFPVLSAYVSAYARLHISNLINKHNGIYTDTDSFFCKRSVETSKKLGGLKLEDNIKNGIIIKPKFYGYINKKGNEKITAKGLGTKINYNQFLELLSNKQYSYKKFLKFKESLRRQMIPNEIIDITKHFTLEDNKRRWDNEFFNPEIYEYSNPKFILQ